jgi:hypothetical protein
MKINLIDGVYNVHHFVSEHNHPLATKQQTHQLRSQRKIDEAQISRIEVAKSIGISTKATIDLLAKGSGWNGESWIHSCRCEKQIIYKDNNKGTPWRHWRRLGIYGEEDIRC